MRNRTVNIVLPLLASIALVLLGTCWCAAAEPKPPAKSVVASGAKLVKLPGKFRFTEGPAVDAKGNVFFTDVPNSRIHKYSLDGKLSVWREDSGGANGLFFDNKVYLPGVGPKRATPNGAGKLIVINVRGEKRGKGIPPYVCFGGADMQTLFITARSSVYTVKMRVKGVRTKSP